MTSNVRDSGDGVWSGMILTPTPLGALLDQPSSAARNYRYRYGCRWTLGRYSTKVPQQVRIKGRRVRTVTWADGRRWIALPTDDAPTFVKWFVLLRVR